MGDGGVAIILMMVDLQGKFMCIKRGGSLFFLFLFCRRKEPYIVVKKRFNMDLCLEDTFQLSAYLANF